MPPAAFICSRGNGYTGRTAVQDYTMLKAAETTKAAGNPTHRQHGADGKCVCAAKKELLPRGVCDRRRADRDDGRDHSNNVSQVLEGQCGIVHRLVIRIG